jgi:hypothetical protein
MTERQNGDQMQPRTFSTLVLVLSMKWVMIVFPIALIGMLLMPFVPNALSTVPEWVFPTVLLVAPLALALISACWQWRRGSTVSAVIKPRIGGPMWLFSALLNRWLYLIVLPVFILVIVLLGKFAPDVLATISPRPIFAIGIGVIVLLLGLRLAEGIRGLWYR